MTWIGVDTAGIPPREGREVVFGGRSLAVFNLGERFAALENRCPHKGGPLADGIVGGTTVTCPLHNWRFCVDTGEVTKPCAEGNPPVRTYPVKMEGGLLLIGVEETP